MHLNTMFMYENNAIKNNEGQEVLRGCEDVPIWNQQIINRQ